MHATTFACPHCSAKLRVRERTFVGADLPCPECREPIRLLSDGPSGIQVVKGTKPATSAREAKSTSDASQHPSREPAARHDTFPPKPVPSETAAPADPLALPLPRTASAVWLERLRTPTVIAWTVATLFATGVLLIVVDPFTAEPAVATRESDTLPTAAEKVAADEPETNATAKRKPPPEPATSQSRLADLGRRLNEYAAAHGHFPRGTVYTDGNRRDDRFSWLAELAAADGTDSAAPLWDQSWRSPINDRFVRRGLPAFQNPAIAERRSADGYPATHFVGIAGVGADAPMLPVDHPRAGIFGIERRTRLEDIKDGTANTMMVAGVREQLGAWAAGGPATMRPLTKEPYINGPDGFGTGQADGMHVLMADGSVRFVSRTTDPRLLRRMAAMADGLPLDPAVPGEPGEKPTAAPPIEEPALADIPPAEAVPEPAVAEIPPALAEAMRPQMEPPTKIDIAAQLAQPLLSFEQVKAVAARELLLQVEELAGVPVEFDAALEAPDGSLDKPVSLSLQKTTVGGLLETIVAEAGLTFEIRERAIRILAAPKK